MRETPPRRPKRPAKKLQDKGGRCFCVGYNWVARYKDEQAVASTEDEAARKVLQQAGEDSDG